jgi:hypothetical protein
MEIKRIKRDGGMDGTELLTLKPPESCGTAVGKCDIYTF